MMPSQHRIAPLDTRVEMFQKSRNTDSFFNMKALAPRPMSNATEFDTDFEDDESEVEDNSPRLSINSSGKRSETTLSSFEEIHTPSPDQEFRGFNFDLGAKPPVEGPRGPHLFRASIDSSIDETEEYVLGMSPMTPRPSSIQVAAYDAPRVPEIPSQHQHRHLSSLTNAVEGLNLNEVSLWTPRQVARWMYDAGFEPSIVEKFQENDISGAILITLKFEDLRELDIPSFGQRTKVWNEIHVLRGSAPSTPKPPTPIEEVMSPCVDIRRPRQEFGSDEEPKRHKSSRRKHQKRMRDPITPLESVSIVGIEQLMPKPHRCAKGENCSKWRKQQRLIDNFKKDHPVSPEGGTIWIAGDPGNPLTAPAVDTTIRPVSDAVPSVVASSDVLGPGPIPAFHHLEEASLRSVQSRDPQENVKQFIQFQNIDPKQSQWSSEEPPTPPYETFPTLPNPHSGLRSLPRLAIPPPRPAPPPRSASVQPFSPYRMDRAEAMSPELRNTNNPIPTVYRFGTPFSEMDIPVTAINLGPVSRDASQSVPPNMSYHHTHFQQTPIQQQQQQQAPASLPQRTLSRSSRHPSFALPRVDENISTAPATQTTFHPHQTIPPPRPPHQWSPTHSSSSTSPQYYNHYQPQTSPTFSPPSQSSTSLYQNASASKSTSSITHSGPMRKRKTKLLRHEWHEHHFTLRGTRLAMHKDSRALNTLEYIDVDDYAIACSSLASGGKLNAAFKAMNISLGKEKERNGDVGAFAFQLVPQPQGMGGKDAGDGKKLKKRESRLAGHMHFGGAHIHTHINNASSGSAGGSGKVEGAEKEVNEGKDVGGKWKTHYFAVKSRDERIDWMRELMLAKALKQKSEGYEVNVNGNMI